MKNQSVIPISCYPWFLGKLNYLLKIEAEQKLAHAYLWSSIEGLGLDQFAHFYSKHLLCRQNNLAEETPAPFCNVCNSCLLLEAKSHPDFLLISPEKSDSIKIDEIRHLKTFIETFPRQSLTRLVLILEAERMNPSASNALLKVLEEPPSAVKIILVTHRPYQLLPTLISRCQWIRFNTPLQNQSCDWLMQVSQKSKHDCTNALMECQGSPLLALAWMKEDKEKEKNQFLTEFSEVVLGQKNPVRWAEQLGAENVNERLNWLISLLPLFLRQKLYWGSQNQSLPSGLTEAKFNHPENIFNIWNELLGLKAQLNQGVRFHFPLFWDRVILQFL